MPFTITKMEWYRAYPAIIDQYLREAERFLSVQGK